MATCFSRKKQVLIAVSLLACAGLVLFPIQCSSGDASGNLKKNVDVPVLVVGKLFKDCDRCPEMVVIQPGEFFMGGNDGLDHEQPPRLVRIGKSFAIGRVEVTQAQWVSIMGDLPATLAFKNCGEDCPVENVNWADAQKFLRKLSAQTGELYRLPTEAEWEYACRAGSNERYCGSNNPDVVAWYEQPENLNNILHKVAQKQPNAWGLYDMSGNVFEWVEDCYHDNYEGAPLDGSAWVTQCKDDDLRMLRGGSWHSLATYSRASSRYQFSSKARTFRIGFRAVRDLHK